MNKQVILLMTDTTRKDMLGCYGNSKMITPNLDKLANMGIKYENAYCCQPVCGPARSAIFTGTFPHTNGMVSNSLALGDNVKTIGQRLNDNEIKSCFIGKWHLDGTDYFGNGICPEGWDEKYWYDMRKYLEEMTDEDRVRSRNSKTAYEDISEDFTYAHKCTNKALEFLNENENNSFFLTVSYDEPHGPSLCPHPYNTMYKDFKFDGIRNFEDDLENKPLMQRLWSGDYINLTAEQINKPSKELALFLGCNSFVDYEIGRVLDLVYEKYPEALVIFTSDHGDMLGSHKLQMKNATGYKEVSNIPFIIKGGEINKTLETPVSHIDIVPTILEFMGINIPKLLEGKSILKQIYDTKQIVNECVFIEFTRYEVDHDGFGGMQIMRAGVSQDYKLVLNLLDTDEFYDMKNDPFELNNLINDNNFSKQRDYMHDKILEQMNRTRDVYRGYQWLARTWRKDVNIKWDNDGYTRQKENTEYEPVQLDYDTGLEIKEPIRLKSKNDEKSSNTL